MNPFLSTFILVWELLKLIAMLIGWLFQAVFYLLRGLFILLYIGFMTIREMIISHRNKNINPL